jgi:sugar phosphate isomerase/epimerase
MSADTLPVAAQLYTLAKLLKTPADLAAALKKIKAMGYAGVQNYGGEPVTAAEFKRMLDGEGLVMCSTQLLFDRIRDSTAQVIEENLLYGAKYVVVAIMSLDLENMRSRAGYERFIAETVPVSRKLAAAGLKLGYHNHDVEFERLADGSYGMSILFEENRNPLMFAEIDTYWVQHGGANPVAWIKKMQGRIPLLHLKDYGMRGRAPIMAEIGDGNLDWPQIFSHAAAAGVEWYIVERDRGELDPFDSLRKSMENIRQRFAGYMVK